MVNFKPSVSVIVPCYNYGRFLEDCLSSLANQTYKNFDVLIVDDGSTDNSASIAKKYAGKFNNFNYVYQKNRGLSGARNTGIKKTDGEYICFVDPDDIWFENKLEVQIDYLKHNQDCGLLYSDAEIYKDGAPTGRTIRNGNNFFHGYVYEKMLLHNGVVCPSVMVKRECFEKEGLFLEGLKRAEDWEMWLRIAKDFKFCSLTKPLLYYRVHEDNNSHTNIPMIYKSKKRVLAKHLQGLESKRKLNRIKAHHLLDILNISLRNKEIFLAFKIYFELLRLNPIKYFTKIVRIIKNLPK